MSATSAKSDTPFVSVATAARALDVSQATIRRWVDRGELAGYKLASTRRILRSELDRLVDGQERA